MDGGAAEVAEESPLLASEVLYRSGSVEVVRWRCLIDDPGLSGDHLRRRPTLTFVHRGAFCLHRRGRQQVVDPRGAVWFDAGACYRVSHPFGCGDRGSALSVTPELAGEILEAVLEEGGRAPSAGSPPGPVGFVASSRAVVLQRLLLRRLAGPWAADPAVEETALAVVAQGLGGALAAGGERPRRRSEPPLTADQRRYVDRAREAMLADFRRPLTLDAIARRAYVSPFHLCRLFKRATGLPVHRYLVKLRLAAALDELLDGETGLAALARRVGFAGHSHFTAAFRREFGVTPTAVRRAVTPAGLARMRAALGR